ncbi:MAG: S16 family serine protease [Desulfobacterales bacterium]
MSTDYRPSDYAWIRELLDYPRALEERLAFFEDTAEVPIPEDPIERVIFQERAKAAIRKVAQNRGHLLLVGRPGTGKSLLAEMFEEVLDRSLGDYLRPRESIAAFPGKDRNHIRVAYEAPEVLDRALDGIRRAVEAAQGSVEEFSLEDAGRAVRRVRRGMLIGGLAAAVAGVFFPAAWIAAGLAGMGAVFLYLQEVQIRVQERIQRDNGGAGRPDLKQLADQIPEVLYDPRKERALMARIAEPSARNMKGGFRHDPYQSGNLQTPCHKRAFLGAHATSPILYIDELKTLVRVGYMAELLEVMQNRKYILEGGRQSGSGAADRSENPLRAENILIACCNYDTLAALQQEGDGAFLSRIEDKGEIVHMESAVPETPQTVRAVAQYLAQEVRRLGEEFRRCWGEVLAAEGPAGVRRRSEHIFGRRLPEEFRLEARPFSRAAVMEIVRELRCRASDGKLSAMLRPINGVVLAAEFAAIFENAPRVEPPHVRRALEEHLSLEGGLARELLEHRKYLKKYIAALSDSIGYVVGLAVIHSAASGQMFGQPLPIHGQVTAGSADTVTAPGRMGEIAKAAAQNVRASIKRLLDPLGAAGVGYEMHVEYIQAHDGVEGDSASVAMDIALVSDFIRQPVNPRYGVTGSLTGDIILAVGGVAEKIRSILDPDLGMEGACVPWLNKHDIEPLLVNAEAEFIRRGDVPGIRIYRGPGRSLPFDIFFCKTKYNAYEILMGIGRETLEARMAERIRRDLASLSRRSAAAA